MDTFSKYNKDCWKLTNGGRGIMKTDSTLSTCYGSKIISSNNKQIHRWKIRVISAVNKSVIIGIDEASCKWIESSFIREDSTKSYGIYGNTVRKYDRRGSGQAYDVGKFGSDDTIVMILNMANKTISFGKNGTSPTKAFDVEPSDIGYCLAVYMTDAGNCIEIFSYEVDGRDEDEKQNETQQLKVKYFIFCC